MTAITPHVLALADLLIDVDARLLICAFRKCSVEFSVVDRLPEEGHTLGVLVVQLEAKDGYFHSDGERPE